MSKKNYEIPLCESVKLVVESPMLTASGPDQFGEPGMPGNDLGTLDPIIF